MTNTFHSSLIPSLMRGLTSLQTYLAKVAEVARDAGESEDYYLQARLAPDMFPFTVQVRIATDTARVAAARLANIVMPLYEGDGSTVDELQERVAKSMAFLRSVTPAELEGAEERMIDQRFRGAPFAMRGIDFVDGFVLPNFYFHVAI